MTEWFAVLFLLLFVHGLVMTVAVYMLAKRVVGLFAIANATTTALDAVVPVLTNQAAVNRQLGNAVAVLSGQAESIQ